MSNKQAGVWVKAELANKREDMPHKNLPKELLEVYCSINGDMDCGYIDKLPAKEDFWFNSFRTGHRIALSNVKSFIWLDEQPIPVKLDEETIREFLVNNYYNLWCNLQSEGMSGECIKAIKELSQQFPIPVNHDESVLWEQAARVLYMKHNPDKSIDSVIGGIILNGFRKDMATLSESYSIQLKSSPSPTPVQEGLREDELWRDVGKTIMDGFDEGWDNENETMNKLKSKYTIQLK